MGVVARIAGAVAILSSFALFAESDRITHQEITFKGQNRSYELFLPDADSTPRPLLLLMHPTGQREIRLAEAWKSLANKEHIVLAAPSSTTIESWSMKDDPPAYIEQVITDVKVHHAVDPKRVYVFGFSAGAHYTIKLCLAFPSSFAACGSAMGALEEKLFPNLEGLHGKVPLILFTGTEDDIVPPSAVLATYKALQARGYEVRLQNYPGQDHNYYRLSGEINKKAWAFMSAHELPVQ
jgi:poly(3-hydroxybutyrate) depolymerase